MKTLLAFLAICIGLSLHSQTILTADGLAGLTTTPSAGITNVTGGLVGWWKFDENTGTSAADSSGVGNNGTFNGTPLWTNGVIGSALSFAGSGQDVVIASTSFPSTNNDRTICMWIKPYSYPAWAMPFCYGTASGGNAFSILWNNAVNKLTVGKFGANASGVNTTGFTTNSWQHFAVTLSGGSSIAYYFNGVTNGTATLAGINTVVSVARIADCIPGYGVPSYAGELDDVRIYNRALTTDEITLIYNWRGKP